MGSPPRQATQPGRQPTKKNVSKQKYTHNSSSWLMPVPATLLEALGTWRRGNVSKRLNNHHQQKWTKDLLPIDTSEKMRQIESQFLNKELEKKTCEQTLLSEKQLRKRAPEEQTSKALSCKNMSYKMDELQRLCIAKKLVCKNVELQEQPTVFRKNMKSFSFHWVLQFWIVLTYFW